MSPVSPSQNSSSANGSSLGRSARSSLLWSGGFTIIRDIAQFGAMLILVRLLSPADYGIATLAQSIFGIIGAFSVVTFSAHTLCVRDPADIDWQVQFTAATVLNLLLVSVVSAIAFGISFSEKFSGVALPLGALAFVFLVEIPGALRHRMLETAHDWKRFRFLLLISTFLALGSGLLVAWMGGGVWALIVQMPMLGLPAAVDLLLVQRFRPDWSWNWNSWRETFHFGIDRIGAGFVGRGRTLTEQALLSSFYGLTALGVFGRATGLAVLIAGRIGSVALMSLTPVMTRAEAGSARFQRLADLVLRGVVWATLPAAAFLGLTARETVALLYGTQWDSVAALVPLAALSIGLGGIVSALSSLLLANDGSRASMSLDIAANISGMAVALTLIPFGTWTYLAGLSAHALIVTIAALVLLQRHGAITTSGVTMAFVPPLLAMATGLTAAFALRNQLDEVGTLIVRVAADALVFGSVYLVTLRFVFPEPLGELVDVVPGGVWLARLFHLRRSVLR